VLSAGDIRYREMKSVNVLIIRPSGSLSTRYRSFTANRMSSSIRLTHLEDWFVVTIGSIDDVSFEEDARGVLGGGVCVGDLSVT